jgi:hypothetical protein
MVLRPCRPAASRYPKAGRSLTLIEAISVRELQGVQVLNEALIHCSFTLYSSRILGPRLRRGKVLVLDNLSVHYLIGLREQLAKRGA